MIINRCKPVMGDTWMSLETSNLYYIKKESSNILVKPYKKSCVRSLWESILPEHIQSHIIPIPTHWYSW